jgi:hypothetical protein
VALRLEHGGDFGAASRGDQRVGTVQRVALAHAPLQHHADAQHVAQEQRMGFDEHALAVRVRLADDRHRAEQAVRIRVGHGARFGRAGGGHDVHVARL